MQAPPPSGLCPHLPATPSPTSCTPPVILLSLLWQQEQAQLHLQLPQLSRPPAANPFHPELPFSFHSRPTPTPGLTVPGSAGGGQRAAAGSWGPHSSPQHRDTLQHACNSPHGRPSDACEQLLLQAPGPLAPPQPPFARRPHRARPRQSRCVWARTKVPPGTAGLWAVGLQATAGQRLMRLRLRLEAGRPLGLRPGASEPFPTRLPGKQTLKRQPGERVAEGGQCVCVCARARVGTCGRVQEGVRHTGSRDPPLHPAPRGPRGLCTWTWCRGSVPVDPDSTRDVPSALHPAPGLGH